MEENDNTTSTFLIFVISLAVLVALCCVGSVLVGLLSMIGMA